jgi:hypothetical protein
MASHLDLFNNNYIGYLALNHDPHFTNYGFFASIAGVMIIYRGVHKSWDNTL